MSKLALKSSRWKLDFSLKGKDRSSELPAPPGYSTSLSQVSEASRTNDTNLVIKRSWDIALGPLKQIPMNLLIMYMSGDSIGVFPIMMIGMMLLRTVKALLSVQQAFKMIEGNRSALQKFVYFIGNLLSVGLALYKLQAMGILPTHASDWLAFVQPQQQLEFSYGGIMFGS